jgi:hypothetical protein
MTLVGDIRVEIPGPLLDALYTGICSCGSQKDFGYMVLTAQRWADYHESKGHDCVLSERETTPLERQKILKKVRSRGRICDTIRIAEQAATL